MKPIILRQHEVIHLRDTGSVIVWRVVKPQPPEGGLRLFGGKDTGDDRPVWHPEDPMECSCDDSGPFWKCPYGRTGEDRWVKETFVDGYPSDCGELQMFDEDGNELPKHVWYRSDDKLVSNLGAPMEEWLDDMGAPLENIPWRSSTHMPRWASRFTVTLDVGLKRIQEVTEEEAKMSGCECVVCGRAMDGKSEDDCHCFHAKAGRNDLRNQLEPRNPGSWDRNDYFWKITCTLKKP